MRISRSTTCHPEHPDPLHAHDVWELQVFELSRTHLGPHPSEQRKTSGEHVSIQRLDTAVLHLHLNMKPTRRPEEAGQ